jgi:hypothetical protein
LDAMIHDRAARRQGPMRGRRLGAGDAAHCRDESPCHLSHRSTEIAD